MIDGGPRYAVGPCRRNTARFGRREPRKRFLTAYDRPFYERADNLVLGPLNPAETGQALGLDTPDAIDARVPGLGGSACPAPRCWPGSRNRTNRGASWKPSAPGNAPTPNIAAAAGSHDARCPPASSPLLRRQKHILEVEHPLSTQPGKPALHRIADSNLRFCLAALRQAEAQVRRGRPDAAYRLIERRWTTWRGKAVEPLIREALELAAAAGALPWPDTQAVGGWWNRQFDPEIDFVGADHHAATTQIPGYAPGTTGTVIASLSGTTPAISTTTADVIGIPADIIEAWQEIADQHLAPPAPSCVSRREDNNLMSAECDWNRQNLPTAA